MSIRQRVVVLLTLVSLAACDDGGSGDGSTTIDTGRATPTSASTATTVAPPRTSNSELPKGSDVSVFPDGDIDANLQPFIDQATTDLATRLDIDATSITTVSAVLVTWNDSSLGCPQPGMQYLQVLQDGAVIELRVDDTIYRYHSGGNSGPFPCDRPLDPPPTRL